MYAFRVKRRDSTREKCKEIISEQPCASGKWGGERGPERRARPCGQREDPGQCHVLEAKKDKLPWIESRGREGNSATWTEVRELAQAPGGLF